MKLLLIFVILVFSFTGLYSNYTAIDYFNKAEEFYHSGLYVLSFENYQKALSINPYYKEALSGIGDIYFSNNNYDSALQKYYMALDIDPAFEEVLFKLGSYFYKNEDYDTALQHFNEIVNYHPLNENALQSLAAVHIKLENFSEAEKHLETLRKIAPTYIKYIFRRAELLEAKNKIDEAMDEYKKLLHIDPVIDDIYFKLADIYADRNQYSDLENVLVLAANSSNKNIAYKAKTYLTKYYLFTKQYRSVISLWLNDPHDAVNNYNLGLAYKYLAGNLPFESKEDYYRRALSYFTTVLKYDSNNDFAVENIIDIFLKIKRVDNQSRRQLSNTYYIMGNNAFNFQGKNKLAYLYYNIAKRLDPQNYDIRYNLARLQNFLNYNDSASNELNIAFELNNNNNRINDLRHLVNLDIENSRLSEFEYEKNKIRYKIVLAFNSHFLKTNHFDLELHIQKRLIDMLDLYDKFSIIVAPSHYESFEQVEHFSRKFNADAIITVDIFENNTLLTADMNFFRLTIRNESISHDVEVANRRRYLKISDFTFSRKDKDRFYNLVDDMQNLIVDLFPVTGEIIAIDEKNDLLVNLGFRQGLEEDQELVVYSQHHDSERNIGRIRIIELNEWFSVCEVIDHRILHILKLFDVVVKSE